MQVAGPPGSAHKEGWTTEMRVKNVAFLLKGEGRDEDAGEVLRKEAEKHLDCAIPEFPE